MYNEWDLLGGSTVEVRKSGITALLAAGVLLLGGCEMLEQETWTPEEADAIELHKDGSITESIQETLDAAYYDSSELQAMVNAEVQEYNGKNGEDSVKVKSYRAEGDTVKLVLTYASAEDYAQFNNVEFSYGSLIHAQLEGYLFDVPYQRISGGSAVQTVSGSEVIKHMDADVLVVRAPLEIKVPGSVLFTSTNAEMISDNIVHATGESAQEEEPELVLPSNTVYHGEEETFEETQAANRVYIIFEKD